MRYEHYEKKINDVIMKCPIEAGVEILVYNLLDEIISSNELALVDINRIRKDRDDRLMSEGGISDIAVLSNDFEYKTNKGKVYGFIEVKATNVKLSETEQVNGQKKSVLHHIYTNGLVWKYCRNKEGEREEWEVVLGKYKGKECEVVAEQATEINIDPDEFKGLVNKLQSIKWL